MKRGGASFSPLEPSVGNCLACLPLLFVSLLISTANVHARCVLNPPGLELEGEEPIIIIGNYSISKTKDTWGCTIRDPRQCRLFLGLGQ